ncbi:MAG: adenosine deaminase [Alphaproteobacteria bacterium]|nr:adenosine deaminase [Alphaproteobacteria bacterium]
MTERDEWLATLPKAELHLHLEGAIPLPALFELIQTAGGNPAVPTIEALRQRLVYPDFPAFIDTWIWKNSFLRSYDDFTFIAEAVAADLARQNIRYAELFFSPSRFADLGLTPARLAKAIRSGFDLVPEITLYLIADLVRDLGPRNAAGTLAEIVDVADEAGILGIGIGGSEHLYPPEPFAPVYDLARKAGLRTSAHAGEAAGAQSVRGAVEVLRVDRVGHALRAEEDEAVIDLLAEIGVVLELCPLSNLATGVIRRPEDHPVRRYWERGLNITVNTDDPGMFHNSLAGEYALLMDVFGFDRAEICRLAAAALEGAWCRPEEKAALRPFFAA